MPGSRLQIRHAKGPGGSEFHPLVVLGRKSSVAVVLIVGFQLNIGEVVSSS